MAMRRSLVYLSGLLLFVFSAAAMAAANCSGYLGKATINEVNVNSQGNTKTRFVEVKILDPSIAGSVYDNWTIRICKKGGGCTGPHALVNGSRTLPYIVLDEGDIPDGYITLSDGMDIILKDAAGKAIDYLSVDGYEAQKVDCHYVYDKSVDKSNTFTIRRIEDGTGDWTYNSGNSGPITEQAPNLPGAPTLYISNITVSKGQTATFTITLGAASSSNVSFRYQTMDDTARAGVDYVATSGTATIPAGSLQTTVSVNTIALSPSMSDVNFYLLLTDPVNANIGYHFAIATIVAVSLHHFQIDVGAGAASTCTPRAVTITAKDAANNTLMLYAGLVSIRTSSGHGDWSINSTTGDIALGTLTNGAADDGAATYLFVTLDGGSIVLNLSNVHADDLQIIVEDALAGVTTTSSEVVSFRDNAFVITPTTCTGATCPGTGSTEVVAARPHGFQVAMWRRDPVTGNCGIATDYAPGSATNNVKAWITRDASDPGGNAPSIAGSGLPTAAPAANNVTLAFTLGVATFTLATTDVGKYTLNLRDDTSGYAKDQTGAARAIDGSSNTLTVRPFGLGFTNIQQGATSNTGGTATGGNPFVAAGAAFQATLGAYLWKPDGDDADGDGVPDAGADVTNNGLTPAYAWATPLSAVLDTPAGGVAGALALNDDAGNLTVAANAFAGGSAANLNLRYAEVGSMFLSAQAVDFLNTTGVNINGLSGVVGRFFPDHFTLTANAVTPWCGGLFTYMGQPSLGVSYTLEARTVAGGGSPFSDTLTTNYATGGYTTATVTLQAEDNNDGTNRAARLAVAASTWIGGQYAVNDTAATFARDAAPDGSFENLIIGVAATDADGATIQNLDMNAATNDNCTVAATCTARALGNTVLRFGRLAMQNAYGSELLDLAVPLRTEYWNGTAFVINGADSCTTLALNQFTLTSAVQTVTANNPIAVKGAVTTTASLTDGDVLTAGDQLTAGNAGYSFTAPGTGGDGWVDTVVDLSAAGMNYPWLQFDWDGNGTHDNNSTARATFGLYGGNARHIYLREVY